jgi:hypothetical protein
MHCCRTAVVLVVFVVFVVSCSVEELRELRGQVSSALFSVLSFSFVYSFLRYGTRNTDYRIIFSYPFHLFWFLTRSSVDRGDGEQSLFEPGTVRISQTHGDQHCVGRRPRPSLAEESLEGIQI